jgi:hypothetical protein
MLYGVGSAGYIFLKSFMYTATKLHLRERLIKVDKRTIYKIPDDLMTWARWVEMTNKAKEVRNNNVHAEHICRLDRGRQRTDKRIGGKRRIDIRKVDDNEYGVLRLKVPQRAEFTIVAEE